MPNKKILILFLSVFSIHLEGAYALQKVLRAACSTAQRFLYKQQRTAFQCVDGLSGKNSCARAATGSIAHYFSTTENRSKHENMSNDLFKSLNLPSFPVYKNLDNPSVDAYVDPLGLHIDDNAFEKMDPSVNKFILNHESSHLKHSDIYVQLFMNGGAFFAGLSIFKNLYNKSKITALSFLSLFAFVSKSVINSFIKYCENRSDRDAAYDMECGRCVEIIANHYSGSDNRANEGYLKRTDFLDIAKELKSQNKYCPKHCPKHCH